MQVYEIRPRKDKRGVDLISDALPFGALWYAGQNAVNHAIGYAKFSVAPNELVTFANECTHTTRRVRASSPGFAQCHHVPRIPMNPAEMKKAAAT